MDGAGLYLGMSVASAQAPSARRRWRCRTADDESHRQAIPVCEFQNATVSEYPGNVEATFDDTYSTIHCRPLLADVYRVQTADPSPLFLSMVAVTPAASMTATACSARWMASWPTSHRALRVIPISYRLAFSQVAGAAAGREGGSQARANADKFGIDRAHWRLKSRPVRISLP
jgi:hypothetical protein